MASAITQLHRNLLPGPLCWHAWKSTKSQAITHTRQISRVAVNCHLFFLSSTLQKSADLRTSFSHARRHLIPSFLLRNFPCLSGSGTKRAAWQKRTLLEHLNDAIRVAPRRLCSFSDLTHGHVMRDRVWTLLVAVLREKVEQLGPDSRRDSGAFRPTNESLRTVSAG